MLRAYLMFFFFKKKKTNFMILKTTKNIQKYQLIDLH